MVKPIIKERDGGINIAVWENEGNNGTWKSATIQKQYTKDNGATWQESKTFTKKDLENLKGLIEKVLPQM